MNIKNTITLIGRLTKDISTAQTPSGTVYTHFSVAVDRPYRKDKDGNEVKECDFINCTAWGAKADFIKQYFSKGDVIMLEGELRNQNYTNKDNVKIFTYVVNVNTVNFPLTAKSKAEQNKAENNIPLPEDFDDFEEMTGDTPFK